MTITLTQAVVGIGCLALLLWALYGPWQSLCTDVTRQILFEKRDAIFDIAQSGRLSFASREYRAIRSSLQAQIRFAHELTLPRFLVLGATLQANGALAQRSTISEAIDNIRDTGTRDEVSRLIMQANRALFAMMYVKSPVMLLSTPVFIAIFGLLAIVKRARRTFDEVERRTAAVVQVEAEFAPSESSRAAAA